jgi:hypothetical protein
MDPIEPTRTAPSELEQSLQDAFVRGEFDRLLIFACWCAGRTLEPTTPQRWRDAMDLAHRRALKRIPPDEYANELRAMKAQLPIASTVIGLKHGVPSAATLLAIVAALDPGPLSAALGAASHQRLHARLRAQELDSESFALTEPVVVDVDRGWVVSRPAVQPTTAEAETATWQFAIWRAMGNAQAMGR